ncbi:hypothetical protein QL285_069130 [Trifolium repens]|nr:hypothetical protein QL285_069130 [Trifolium repens]
MSYLDPSHAITLKRPPNIGVKFYFVSFLCADDRNFYGIFSIIISSKMTKTGPNTKENLQKQEKASRQSPRCKKTRKSPKSEENQHSIAARWLLSCHDGSCLFAKKSEEINLKKIFALQHDGVYRSTMT